MNCESWGDTQTYLNDYGYRFDVHDYDKDSLVFPNIYVLCEEYVVNEDEGYDEYGLPNKEDLHLRIYTLEEYKNKILNEFDYIANR